MNIKKLLEYSKIDAERREEIKRFQKLEVVEEYHKKSVIIKKARMAIEKLNKDAEEIIKQMQSVSKRYSDVLAQIEEAEKYLDSIQDESEADFYIKNIGNYISTLDRLAEEAKKINEKIVNQRTNCETFMNAGKVATQEAKAIQGEYKEASSVSKKICEEFDKKLEAIAKEIDKEDLDKYKLVASENKYPPIHVLTTKYCYCTMEMPVSVIQRVKSAGWGICPDCGRILISEEMRDNSEK